MYLLILLVGIVGPLETGTTAASPVAYGPSASDGNVVEAAPPDSVYSIASFGYTYESVTGIQAWQTSNITVRTSYPDLGVFVLDFARWQRRFGRHEIAGGGEYWAELWGRSYGHLFVNMAPPALTMPKFSIGGEHYEVVRNWEISVWFEWRHYGETLVQIIGPQLAWYPRGWYVRTRTSFVERDGIWAVTQRFAARRFLGAPTSFLDFRVGYGSTVELARAAATVANPLQVTETYFAGLEVSHFVTDRFGFSATANYTNAIFERVGVSVALLTRW